MEWIEVINHPNLQNLPFKIELNERGEVVMNPFKVKRSIYQGQIAFFMRNMRSDGMGMAECAINQARELRSQMSLGLQTRP